MRPSDGEIVTFPLLGGENSESEMYEGPRHVDESSA
jgi:hypothetical protein